MYTLKKRIQTKLLCSVAALPLAVAAQVTTLPAYAQSDDGASSLETIMVTARRRQESILQIPLSVQAFSADELEEAGLIELETVANFTANLDFQSLGNSQPGRYNSAIRFRGMESSITTPTNQTGAFFVDGVNVLGGASSVDFSDLQRIEVIRGPQPVFFGRGTFGGAINYVTADPAEEFGGQISGSYSPNFGSHYISGYLEGAIAPGLTARVTAFSRQKGAMFTATDGGELGAESTDGISVIALYEPNNRLRVKARVAYSQDDDGPPSSTFVAFREVGNTPVGTPITVQTSNGQFTGAFSTPYHRGIIPEVPVSSNTRFYDVRPGTDDEVNVRDVLIDQFPVENGPDLAHFGLRTNSFYTSLAADYDVSDTITVSGLFGYNDRSSAQLRDSDQTDSPAWALRTFLELESWSAEGRVYYDADGPLRITAGVNYAVSDQLGDIDGGFNVFDGIFGGLQLGVGGSALDVVKIETLGIFGAIEYDILDWLTFSAEGRFQSDKLNPRVGVMGGPLTAVDSITFDEFLPRAILSAQPFEGSNFYISYAQGTLPGVRNTVFDALSAADRAAAQAQFPQIQELVGSEKLETFELGWKQELLNGSLWFSAVGFLQYWDNMKATGFEIFTSPTSGNTFSLFPTLAAESKMTGFEFEARWQASEKLGFQMSYGYVDAVFQDFSNRTFNRIVALPAGSNYNAAGSTLPRSPKHSGAISADWSDRLTSNWDYNLRLDGVYKGKTFTDPLNVNQIDSYFLTNARVGVQNEDGLSLEVFCTNCFGTTGWATGRRLTDFGQIPNFFANQGVVVDALDRFEAGVRATYKF